MDLKESFHLASDSATTPMPDGSSSDVKTFSCVGPGQAEGGTITLIEPDVYSYVISEGNCGVSGYSYDETTYMMTVTVTEEGGRLRSPYAVRQGWMGRWDGGFVHELHQHPLLKRRSNQ